MRIAFIGDSFCASPDDASWCTLLAKQLGARIECLGKPGGNIWDAHKCLTSRLRRSDLVVCCYTDHGRIPNRLGYPLNRGSAADHKQQRTDVIHGVGSHAQREVWDAAVAYYDWIYDDEYMVTQHALLVSDMDRIIAESGKTAIHLPCWDMPGMEWRSGMWSRHSLMHMLNRHGKTNIALDHEHNHMNDRLNAKLAELLAYLVADRHVGPFGLPGC